MATIEDMKLPPHHLEAEKGFLSCVLMDNEVMYLAESLQLQWADFYQKEHQFIYEALATLWSARKTIDIITLSDQLTKQQQLDIIGGQDYLYEIAAFVITPTVANEYATIVKEKSILRNVLKTCQQIAWEVYAHGPVQDILESIEKKIFDLTQVNLSDSLRHIKDLLNKRVEDYMELVDNPQRIEDNKVFSKFSELDELLGGFKPGDLCIIAARPSMGKTSFALNILMRAALQSKKIVSIFSLEMGQEQIVDRVLALVSGTPMHKITRGALDEDDFAGLGEAMEKLSSCQLFIDDKGALNLPELRSKLRRLKIERGWLDLVVIDYLQLMNTGGSNKWAGNRVQEISEISRGLKEIARELKVPVVALSQLNRSLESRPDKRPQLSDLRDSGAIEQDADTVLMLYREDYYDPYTEKKGLANVFVRKNRNGPTWEVELKWLKENMEFFDLA
jgi:replicative DNA helicase